MSSGLDFIGKSTTGASGFNVGFKNLPKQTKTMYNRNQVQNFLPKTRVIVSRPASTGDGLIMGRNMSWQHMGESFKQDNTY